MGELVPVLPLQPAFKGRLKDRRWTLCVGAGISVGIAPNWLDLTRDVVNHVFKTSYDTPTFKGIVHTYGWGLDAWIQAAANQYLLDQDDLAGFNDLLESRLYSRLLDDARQHNSAVIEYLVQVLNRPQTVEMRWVEEVCSFIETTYAHTSLVALVHFLIAAAKQGQRPVAVITFNADTFLETLIHLFLRREQHSAARGHVPPSYYRAVHRPMVLTHAQALDETFIYHCHGTIMPWQSAGEIMLEVEDEAFAPHDARDRLVFLEQEYLRVASVAASWPQTLFSYHAQTSRMVFVGMSMSDPNIRRWMRTSQLESNADLQRLARGQPINPHHSWVDLETPDDDLSRIRLVSMLHLGIRPALIPNWSDLGPALANWVGLKP